ncbi:hypothetical protein, partial [Caballeronia sp. M23-90]
MKRLWSMRLVVLVRQPTNGRKGKTFGGICMTGKRKICYLETRGAGRYTALQVWDNNLLHLERYIGVRHEIIYSQANGSTRIGHASRWCSVVRFAGRACSCRRRRH